MLRSLQTELLTSHATTLKVYYDDRSLLSTIISPGKFQPFLFSHTGVCLIVVIFWNVNRLLLFLTKYQDLARGCELLKGGLHQYSTAFGSK